MKLLVLGGTGVTSRQIVLQAVNKGYDVTIFNRGNRVLPECAGAKVVTGNRADENFSGKFSAVKLRRVSESAISNLENNARRSLGRPVLWRVHLPAGSQPHF